MKRLIYLDNLRSIAMVWGVFLHVGTLGNFPGYGDVFGVTSEYFRMALFFMLSGYFGALMLDRRSVDTFVRQRLLNLGVPLLTCLILLNPITLWLVFRYHNMATMPDFTVHDVFEAVIGRSKANGPMIWHLHLWFLFSLIFYVLAAPMLREPVRRLAGTSVVCRLGASVSSGPVLWLLTAAIVLMVFATVTLNKLISSITPDYWLVRATLSYWPYYIVGMFLYSAQGIWEKVHRVDPTLICVSALGLWFAQRAGIDGLAGSAVDLVVKTVVRCTIIFALLALFSRLFNRQTRISVVLSESIYTVYLLHYFVIYLVANLWISAFQMNGAACWFIVAATLGLTFGFHWVVVRKIPLIRLCLNGKIVPA